MWSSCLYSISAAAVELLSDHSTFLTLCANLSCCYSRIQTDFANMSCASSAEVTNAAPTMLQPGFSFTVAFEALHSRLTLELQNECQSNHLARMIEVEECELASRVPGFDLVNGLAVVHKQINEARNDERVWRVNMSEKLREYETRKCKEFARLREESERRVLETRHQAEQQLKSVKKLHAFRLQELFDLFVQTQEQDPIAEELLTSIQTRTNLHLQDVLEMQQHQIQDLQCANLLSQLREQNLEEETARLRLSMHEKEEILASLTTEVEELIPKLHGHIEAREHMLLMTLKEKTKEDFHKLELSLRNEQRENAWMQRALKENKRKRADRLSRLQQQVTALGKDVAEKDEMIAILQRGFHLSNFKDASTFTQFQLERTIC